MSSENLRFSIYDLRRVENEDLKNLRFLNHGAHEGHGEGPLKTRKTLKRKRVKSVKSVKRVTSAKIDKSPELFPNPRFHQMQYDGFGCRLSKLPHRAVPPVSLFEEP